MANVKDDKFTHDPFALSEGAQKKEDAYQQHSTNKPGEYQNSEYDSIAKGYLNQYQNRGPFSYDFNSDALYQQYKDQYIKQGQMAMMDTMGQAAAMTGGYGNSYAQTVGQQVYNQNLGKLNEIMPELYGMAYDKYQQEGQELLNLYNLYSGLAKEDFDQYQYNTDKWFNMGNVLREDANTAYNRDYNNWELGYNTSWEDYLTTRNENFTTTENEKNRTWESEEAEKSRQFTKEENDKSRTASSKSTSSTSQYKDIDVGGEVYKTILTEVKKVTSLPELQSLVSRYLSLGYNPDQIDQLTVNKYNELMPKTPTSNPTASTNNIGGYGGINMINTWEIK